MASPASLLSLPHLRITKIPSPSPSFPNPRLRLRPRSSSAPPPPPSFDLRSYWTTLLPQIESSLSASIPIQFPPRIFEAMRHSVLAGTAKRAPPIMCVATCELLGGSRSAAFPTACALEMVHAASLVHDDLPCMDAAPLRRGRPSTHALFGVDFAVLAGDALFPLCFSHIVAHTPDTVPPATILSVIAEIARAVGPTGMTAGQFLDIDGAVAGDGVVTVLEKKFGEMAECSAVCGGLLGGATAEEVRRLRRYGRAVGVLYQVVEDISIESANGNAGKMRSNASVVRALGMERALDLADELRAAAKREIEEGFGDKYGERVLPLLSFVDYAVERGFMVEGGERVTAAN